MLEYLKSRVYRDRTVDILMEGVESSAVRDIFLDNMEMSSVAPANDPAIKRLIDNIPAYEESDPEFEKELKSVTESFIPETQLNGYEGGY